jgi:uncharacterized protein (UPF0210 family)
MKIRSITYFCNPNYPLQEKILQKAGQFLTEAKSAYEAAGYEVQTTRLATIPFPELLGMENIGNLPAVTSQIDTIAEGLKIGYVSLGAALPEFPASYAVIPEAIFVSKMVFFGGIMADRKHGVDLSAVRACADVIAKCAFIESNGFANLQFAALANVEAGTPFLPAAYHHGDEPAFAIATESADLAVQAFESAKTIEEARGNLIGEIERHGKQLTDAAKSLKCKFGGIDFSLAPFPSEAESLGTAFERLGVPKIGLHGSLLAAALLTEAIDRGDFLHTGFSGLMMPVLEDATLAKRAAEGILTIKDLLLYSAVCGTGLDTIPLPGDTTSEHLVPLLLDVCALALRLNKPLTARLMPIPGKKAGDETDFDFAFFAPSRIMSLESQPLGGSLGGNVSFSLQSKR